MTIRFWAAAPAAAALITLPAHAQVARDTVRLREIVVTATRLPMPRDLVPSAVTVVSGEELRSRGITHVLDALRSVPGVMVVQTGSLGGQAALFVRGGESDHVRVLVDGVSVNQPGGAVDLADLTTDNLDRIEVVRGPASVLYGSDAMTGVVQIFTRRGAGRARGALSVRSGAFASVPADGYPSRTRTVTTWGGEAEGGSRRLGYSLALSRASADGLYAFNNDYRNTTATAQVTLAPDGRTDARLSVHYGDRAFHFPTDGAGRLVDHNQLTRRRGATVGVEIGRRLASRLEARLLFSDRDATDSLENPEDNPGEGSWRFISGFQRRGADLRANLDLTRATVLTVGGALERQDGHTRYESVSGFGSYAESTDVGRRNQALYTQLLADWSGRVVVQAGLRVDDNETFGTLATYRVAGTLRLAAGTRVRAGHGIAFKEPQFVENFATGFARGNPALRPERSRSWEVGFERALWTGRLTFTASLFHQRFRDLIAYDPGAVAPAPNYVNVVRATARGLEIGTAARAARGLTLGAHYAYLHTRVGAEDPDAGDSTFVAGRRLIRRPSHSASLDLGYRWARGSAGLSAHHVGRRDDLDYSVVLPPDYPPARRATLAPYMRLDLDGTFTLLRAAGARPGIDLSARIENALGHRYEEALGFPARRRAVFVGVRLGAGGSE